MPRTAYIIDDDTLVRRSLQELLTSSGMKSQSFGSGSEFLAELPNLAPGCLLVDMRMPGMNGTELLQELNELNVNWPALVVTGGTDVPTAVEAMKLGAIDVLEKPYSVQSLYDAVERCFSKLENEISEREAVLEQLAKLTAREKDAFEGVASGESSRETAARLGLSRRTAEMHRSRMMKKLNVERASDVMAIASAAGYKLGARDTS